MSLNMKGTPSAGYGIDTSVADLIRVRPDRRTTGFAPGGRVSTHQFGNNRSVFRGRGMEFDEARVYAPGDDVRAIDWQVTARTGQVHTKLFHEERERPVYLLLDLREMMHFGTRTRFKSVLAAEVAAMLAWVAIDGGDRVGALLLTRNGYVDFPATRTRGGVLGLLHAISAACEQPEDDSQADGLQGSEVPLHGAVRRLRNVARPGTLAFIISDFSDFHEQAMREIKRLSLHAHVTNIQVYDPLDACLPARGEFAITDGTGVLSLSALDGAVLRQHETAFAQRRAQLVTMSRQRAMAFVAIATSDDPASVLRPRRQFAHSAAVERTAA